MYICPGCDSQVSDDEIIYPVPEVEERVLPGEVMPAGECPACGELIPATTWDEEGA